MFCSNCGNQVPDDARFCTNCGAALGSPAPAPQPAPFAPYDPTPASAPVAEPTPAAVPEAPAVPVKKKKKILPLILVLLLVVAAAVAAVLLLGKQTVYLVTETVSKNLNGPTTTQRYEYDDEGRITKYEYEMEYPEHLDYSYDMKYEISYEYSKDGKLESAEFDTDDETIEVEYIYKKDVLDGLEVTGLDDNMSEMELEVECDDEGRIESVRFIDVDGEEYSGWEFEYYDNGTIKESSRNMASYGWETISRFNEDGKVIESITYMNDELMYKYIYEYDEDGQQTLMEQYNEDDELQMRYEIEYSFNKDKLEGCTWTIESLDDDGEMIEATIVFVCEWDDLECTMIIDEIDGDEETMEGVGLASEDLEIVFEKDKHGNTIRTEMNMDGELVSKSTTEYEEFKVSRDYREPNIRNDPQYLYFLMN